MTETIERTPSPGSPPGPVDDRDAQRAALLRLAIVVIGGIAAAALTDTLTTVLIVVALIVMIMLHELGHFLTAKWSGMKVTEFFLGFGPRLWSVRKGETEYGIKAIPAGGYVKIVGMHNLDKLEDPADEPRTYRQQPFWQRLMVVSAGSAMHFLIAIVMLWSVNTLIGFPDPNRFEVAELSRLASGPAPAAEAGLEVGDEIVAIDGRRFTDWGSIVDYVQDHPGQPITFTLQRDGERFERTVVPADLSRVEVVGDDVAAPSEPVGFIGVRASSPEKRLGPIAAVPESFEQFGHLTTETFKALGSIFSPSGISDYFTLLTGGEVAGEGPGQGGENRFLSPVGFVRVAGQAADQGVFEVLSLLILINVFVGIFNLLPLLPLDGGHVAIAVYEAVRSRLQGRRHFVDVARLMPVTYLVFMLIVFIGVTSLYLDIVRPINNPFQ